MKLFISIVLLFCSTLIFAQEKSFYGETIDDSGIQTNEEMYALLEGQENAEVKIQGTILETCSVKGCWMRLKLADESEMRIKFKDYAFFVPKSGVSGNTAIVSGVISKEVIDVPTLKHYAEDAGKSKKEIDHIHEEKIELSMVANGVIIFK